MIRNVLKTKARMAFKMAFLLCLSFFVATGCTKNCEMLDHAVHDPSCKNLALNVSIQPPAPATCVAGAKKVSVTCPAGTGANRMCTSLADGLPLIIYVVPNNAGGYFTDTNGTGTTYTTCSALITDILNNLVVGIQAIYETDNSSGNRLGCDDTNGCTLNSTGCFSGWDSVNFKQTGIATALPGGTHVLACAYIDNGSLGLGVAPAAFDIWANAPVEINPGATYLTFANNASVNGTSVWSDAY